MLQIVRILEDLPEDFEVLRQSAVNEGWHHLDRLAEDWNRGALRYDASGEALLAAYENGVVGAIGAVCIEPNPADGPARRMRRFYVGPQFRRRGVGRTLATALIQQGWAAAPLLTVHASKPESIAFWESLGFHPDARNGWSHSLRR
ncbi:MAG TPA: GNAT family N-acetyltransferase [Micropepsaceae bacterium]|nr:GNAT family N-acetyltransferase [Micropepsaceae bacterium]